MPLAAQENPSPAQSDQTQPASSPDEHDQVKPANPPDEHDRILLPAGTVISVRIADRVDSNKLHSGDLLTGIVDPSLIYNDHVVIPRGTEAHVQMAKNQKGGHLAGKAEVQLELVALVMNGRELEVVSSTYQKDQGTLAAKVKSAGPASAGAGADMATGSGPGSGVNPVIAIFRAAKIDLQPNTRVEFTLTAPFTFVQPPADSGK